MVRSLEAQIKRFEELLAEIDESVRKGHEFLKDLKNERKEAEKLYDNGEIKGMVRKRVDAMVVSELGKIGPEIREETNKIYAQVGREIDRLIDLAMGKEFATRHGREDIRPQLAEKLREWLLEIVHEEA